MELTVSESVYQEVLAQALNDEDMVNFCTVRDASTVIVRSSDNTEQTQVSAQIIVYLNPQEGRS